MLVEPFYSTRAGHLEAARHITKIVDLPAITLINNINEQCNAEPYIYTFMFSIPICTLTFLRAIIRHLASSARYLSTIAAASGNAWICGSLESLIYFAFKPETSMSSFGIITSWCFFFSSSFWLLNRASSSDNNTLCSPDHFTLGRLTCLIWIWFE